MKGHTASHFIKEGILTDSSRPAEVLPVGAVKLHLRELILRKLPALLC